MEKNLESWTLKGLENLGKQAKICMRPRAALAPDGLPSQVQSGLFNNPPSFLLMA